MKQIFKSQSGFTLIELIMVIVILAILGAVAIPKYVDLSSDAKSGNETGVASGVRAGLTTYFVAPARGNKTSYPATLDGAAVGACSTTEICFDTVLSQGGITDQWSKLSATTYRSPVNTSNIWTYTPASGNFQKTTS